ncbi:MAG: DegT/DnrJ/EryC1/StrS family aminotransferase, partial [Actinomycetota bacterium]
LEERAADRLGVARVVAVSSCTSGLMLAVRAVTGSARTGGVLLPSFTFSASAHAIAWNGLEPRFVECTADSFQIDPDALAARAGDPGTRAVLATHVFGAPCAPDRIAAVGARHDLPVIFDAAHAFGAVAAGRRIGNFGVAEVFSLTPTKVLVAGEGGLVATDDTALADAIRIGRDYGNPGDYDTRFVGLNARMSEFHAAMALTSLEALDEHLERRRDIADRYRSALAGVPGIGFQVVDPADSSTYKDFTITVDPEGFGCSRDVLARALAAEGIDTRKYFSPPVHRQRAYADLPPAHLPVTDAVAARVLSLPIYPALGDDDLERIAAAVTAIGTHGPEVTIRLVGDEQTAPAALDRD